MLKSDPILRWEVASILIFGPHPLAGRICDVLDARDHRIVAVAQLTNAAVVTCTSANIYSSLLPDSTLIPLDYPSHSIFRLFDYTFRACFRTLLITQSCLTSLQELSCCPKSQGYVSTAILAKKTKSRGGLIFHAGQFDRVARARARARPRAWLRQLISTRLSRLFLCESA
jgi:hypothetical protein